jgi:ssDNA-binding Zn-finger/Zn-ribbon topoisomerase 1
MTDDGERVEVEDDGGVVPWRQVRDRALRLLVAAGYDLEEGVGDPTWDPRSQGPERPLARKHLEGDIFIRVSERPPTPDLRLWLMADQPAPNPDEEWTQVVHLQRVRKVSFRNPDRVPAALERVEAQMRERIALKCPHCGSQMSERKVRNPKSKHRGKTFMGCLRYPDCRGTIADWMPRSAPDDGKLMGAACPDCGEPLVMRYCKQEHLPHRGSSFIGCSGFPKCRRIVTREELTALKLIGPEEPKLPEF